MPVESSLNELSSVIGELRSFAAQQVVTNTHIVDELKKISDRLSGFGEMGATFVEYRKTLHERFGKIHDMFGDVDERLDKLETKFESVDDTVVAWKAQAKTIIIAVGAFGTVLSALISTYGGVLLRAIMAHGG